MSSSCYAETCIVNSCCERIFLKFLTHLSACKWEHKMLFLFQASSVFGIRYPIFVFIWHASYFVSIMKIMEWYAHYYAFSPLGDTCYTRKMKLRMYNVA